MQDAVAQCQLGDSAAHTEGVQPDHANVLYKGRLLQALAHELLLRALQINISPVLHEVGDAAVDIGDDLISISDTGQVTIGGGGSGGSGSGGSGGGSTSSGGVTVAASG
jgi:hypothetical protein